MQVPCALHLAVLHMPSLATMFGLAPLTAKEWRMVAAVCLPVLLLEEALKAVGRAVARRKDRQQRMAQHVHRDARG